MAVAISPSSKTLDALWTWQDLWTIPEDRNLYEIIEGELYDIAPPLLVHQEIVGRVHLDFSGAAKGHGKVYVAPFGVRLGEQDIVEPDIIFVARDRFRILLTDYVDGPPDIVLEVFSPSTRSKDLNEKANLYARSGVTEYWQVDPRQRSVVVLRLSDGVYVPLPNTDDTARSAVLPGLAVHVPSLFEDLT